MKKIVTVDVWDTLLRRHCHPDEVKLAVAKKFLLSNWDTIKNQYRRPIELFRLRQDIEKKIGENSRLYGFDDEYLIDNVWKKIIEVACFSESESLLGHDDKLEVIVNFEYQFEDHVTYADNKISIFLQDLGALSSDRELFFLSDFYAPRFFLSRIIKSRHPDLSIADGSVSCELCFNKRSGRLYSVFLDYVKKSTEEDVVHILHVGDNAHSDVDMALSNGIPGHLFRNETEDMKINKMRSEFSARLNGDFRKYFDLFKKSVVCPAEIDKTASREIIDFAVEVAPIYIIFVIYIIEQAQKQGMEKVYYFTREGILLEKIHKSIKDLYPDHNLPEPVILHVSRLSTFFPSIQSVEIDEFMRIWRMYPNQNIRAFLTTLGLDVEIYSDLFAEKNISIDAPAYKPWENSSFIELINDVNFQEITNKILAEKKRSLINYLKSRGITGETRKVMVVDIGWRGTIQDNLALLMPNVEWCGVYLALFRFLNEQPENVSKKAFLFDDNKSANANEYNFSPQSPIEMLFNSNTGSVIGYDSNNPGIVQTLPVIQEIQVHNEFTSIIQRIAISSAPDIYDCYYKRGLLAEDFSEICKDNLLSVIRNPPKVLARNFFLLVHNERFGNNSFKVFNSNFNHKKIIRNIHKPKKLMLLLKEASADSGWPDGFYSNLGLLTVRNIYKRYKPARYKDKLANIFSYLKKIVNLGRKIEEKRSQLSELNMLKRYVFSANINHVTQSFNDERKNLRTVDDTEFSINWLVPDFGIGSGGHATILRFVSYFQSLKIKNRIYILGQSGHGSDESLRKFVESHYGPLGEAEIYGDSSAMIPCDILIFTLWITAYAGYNYKDTKFKAYFIQDFEPYFYPMSSQYLFAEDTYRFRYYGICASKWLNIKMSQYGMKGCYFNLGYNPEVYYPDKSVSRDPDCVAVYMRPHTERRGTELLIGVILDLLDKRPDINIWIFGCDTHYDFGVGSPVKYFGVKSEEQLRLIHSRSSITLLTSLTNYSLIPIEAMACGSVVIDVDVESNRNTFDDDAPIVLCNPRISEISDSIINLLHNQRSLKKLSAESIDYASRFQWREAFLSVEKALFGEFYNDLDPTLSSVGEGQLVRAYSGTNIYLIRNKKRHLITNHEIFGAEGISLSDVNDIPVKQLLAIPLAGVLK